MNWKAPSIIIGFLLLILVINASLRHSREQAAKKTEVAETSGSTNSGIGRFNFGGPIHELTPTLGEITNGTFRFFKQNGDAQVGFSGKADNLKIYSKPKGTDPLGSEVNPATHETVIQLTKILQDRTNAEIQTLRAKELAGLRDEEVRKGIAHSNEVAKAAADLATYRNHYFSDSRKYSTAVLMVDENNTQNSALSSALASILQTDRFTTTPGLFKPAFINDGLFEKTFIGQSDALNRLPLTNVVRSLVLGQQSVTYSTNSQSDNLITATMTVDVAAISTSTMQQLFAEKVSANGAGLTVNNARKMAEERCLARLTNGALKSISKLVSRESDP